MEECRIILAEQDNLLTFSESQDRCHLGLQEQDNLFTFSEFAGPCRIILVEQDNLLTFSESQDRCHLGLRRLIGSRHFFLPDLKDEIPSSVDRVKTLFFPTSKMEECRIILAEQDNLLTFSESQDRCHLGLRRLIGSRHFFLPDLKDEIVPNYLRRAG
ncbi:hypothetical protein GQ457_05G021540 [Hibiscus cannabinus]